MTSPTRIMRFSLIFRHPTSSRMVGSWVVRPTASSQSGSERQCQRRVLAQSARHRGCAPKCRAPASQPPRTEQHRVGLPRSRPKKVFCGFSPSPRTPVINRRAGRPASARSIDHSIGLVVADQGDDQFQFHSSSLLGEVGVPPATHPRYHHSIAQNGHDGKDAGERNEAKSVDQRAAPGNRGGEPQA